MGFLSKLAKHSIGAKVLKKGLSKDPVGRKLMSKDPLARSTGIVPSKRGPARDASELSGPRARQVRTGGSLPPKTGGRVSVNDGRTVRTGGPNKPMNMPTPRGVSTGGVDRPMPASSGIVRAGRSDSVFNNLGRGKPLKR